jgi:outer membrane protein assembly factor BamB
MFGLGVVVVLTVGMAPAVAGHAQEVPDPGHVGPANSPWPKMLGNARNTGTSASSAKAITQPWLFEDLGADRHIMGAPALDADGTLYIGADNLYALDGNSGRKKWEVHVINLFLWHPIVGLDKTIYVSEDRDFCAIDGRTGTVRWRFKASPEPRRVWKPAESTFPQNAFFGFSGSAALSADGTIYTTSLEGNLYALDSATGKERWRFETHNQIYGSPTIGQDGTVYFTGYDGLYAVDGQAGRRKWNVPHCHIFGPPALGADGAVYVATYKLFGHGNDQEVGISAFDGQTGNRKWEFAIGRGAVNAPAIGEDGTVYAGYEESVDMPAPGKVFAIDGKTGLQKWAFPTPAGVYMAPAIDAANTIYIGSKGGILYAINGATGDAKWQVNIGAEIGTPVAVGANGLIYFGANDGVIYALRASDGAMAPRPK